MTNKYTTQTYLIQCRGRNENGHEVLDSPTEVKLKIHQSPDSNNISSIVNCRYNTGGHGQRCKASHPDLDKIGEGITCPYSFDLPFSKK